MDVAKAPAPPAPVASPPSQSPAPPVIETQKSDQAVPVVPKTVKEVPTARLVVEAVVAKKLVVVALVPVALTKVKFWRVDEALARILAKVPVPDEVRFPPLPVVKKRFVEEAVVEKREVVVALVVVELPVIVRLPSMVEEAVERKPLSRPRVVEVETP